VEDHIHLLVCLHPTIALSDFVKDIKVSASKWIKTNESMPDFANWQDGYAAFTHSIKEKNVLIEYVGNQEEHHRKLPFREELKRLLKEAGIAYDEKYLPE
jgi:REP element-mobilizing transposase RayT